MKRNMIGIAVALALVLMGSTAMAQYRSYGGYGGYGYGSYGYGGYGGVRYSYPSYNYSGYYNRTDQYHYTRPRVTTGYGLRSVNRYPSYYGRSYGYGRGGVNVRYPGGGVNVNYGRYGGGVRVYNGYRGISVGW